MSDEEEESVSEGFSASEEEWKPNKDVRGGESSDDDDSDFEDALVGGDVGEASGGGGAGSNRKRESEPKSRGGVKQTATAAKKRKAMGQSLRTKLYNKYRPPPKTFPSPTSSTGNNSPSASTSRTASKNGQAPNESSKTRGGDNGDSNDNDSSSDSDVEDYLVKPAELDLRSSFFDVGGLEKEGKSSPAPKFDCNAGIGNLSDSGSEDNNESSADEHSNTKVFDFRHLLEKANSLERAKDAIARRTADARITAKTAQGKVTGMDDVTALLALGENQNESTAADPGTVLREDSLDRGPQKLNKTKSTRVKRHTKSRPTSTVGGTGAGAGIRKGAGDGDTDDSDWEEVADGEHSINDTSQEATACARGGTHNESLEIHVELPSKQRKKEQAKLKDIEMAMRRRLNRNLREHQLLLHKTSLLCHFGRSYVYNRMLNDTSLMQEALKLLPGRNAYPTEKGTCIKYFQAFVTWYKDAVKLHNADMYNDQKLPGNRKYIKDGLLQQIKAKAANCKQDLALIFVLLLRAMGLQCRLVVNIQTLALRPSQSDLLKISLKRDDAEDKKSEATATSKKSKEDAAGKDEKKVKDVVEEKSAKAKITGKKLQGKHNDSVSSISNTTKKTENASKKIETQKKETKKTGTTKTTSKKSVSDTIKIEKTVQEEQLKEEADSATVATRTSTRTRRQSKVQLDKEPNVEDEKVPITDLLKRPTLSKLKRTKNKSEEKNLSTSSAKEIIDTEDSPSRPLVKRSRQAAGKKNPNEPGSLVVPQIVVPGGKEITNLSVRDEIENEQPTCSTKKAITKVATTAPALTGQRCLRSRSRSKSPKAYISTAFLQTRTYKEKFGESDAHTANTQQRKRSQSKSPTIKVKISADFLHNTKPKRVLRSNQKANDSVEQQNGMELHVPQLDGADDSIASAEGKPKRPQLKKLQKSRSKSSKANSDEDFQPSPPKKPKQAPTMPKQDRRVLSSDDESRNTSLENSNDASLRGSKRKVTDIWAEVWCDEEERWVCVDIIKGKLDAADAIKKTASTNLAYVFAFQNDLTVKDVTARYCSTWTNIVRKGRVEQGWLEVAIGPYKGRRTKRDRREDQELRRIHEEKPMPTAITEYKDHPLYALERHLLKFQAIYPPNAPTLGFVRREPVYARDCVYTLHSRDIWLKQARVVKLGEEPYKIVKARPKWDRLTQTVIKDQPLEIFGFWQTEDYDPPTAENGIVPRNAYGNVDLFKECMLPKKTVHLRLNGLNRICKKLGIDCANAIIGFDFHQGACHPINDGFVVCEEYAETVTDAWAEDQEQQERKEQEKYEARVYGNWKKLIRGLLIRERLKKKYNF